MEQHPIPQNISSYEFRLVGDMTLKQFFQLSGGIIVGLIIFRLPLYGIVKYPLIFISVFTGVAMAFIPLNGRPFGRWITAFLRAIYSPTEFEWAPSIPPTNTAQTNPTTNQTVTSPTTTTSAAPVSTPPISAPPPPPPVQTTPPTAAIPTSTSGVLLTAEVIPDTEAPKTSLPIKPNQTEFHDASSFQPPPPPPPAPAAPSKPIETPVFQNQPTIPDVSPAPISTTPPQSTILPKIKTAPAPSTPTATNTNLLYTPTIANIISGLVTKPNSDPLESAIIEIIDSQTSIPARALRTNRLGQFQIATPLAVGKYVIQTEKDSYIFDPVSIDINNTIIQPIIISAKQNANS